MSNSVPVTLHLRRLEQAEKHFAKGELVKSLRKCELVLEADPNHLGALELRAKYLWERGEFRTAVETLDRLIELNPYEPGYHCLRGTSLRCLGRYGEAISSLERATGAQGAEGALSETAAWQSAIVSDLERSRPDFRIQSRRDRETALRMHGLQSRAFPGERQGQRTALRQLASGQAEHRATALTARPS